MAIYNSSVSLQVKSSELFAGHNINDSLELLVCQREQEEMAAVTVLGYRYVRIKHYNCS